MEQESNTTNTADEVFEFIEQYTNKNEINVFTDICDIKNKSSFRKKRLQSCLGNDDFNEKLSNDLIIIIFKYLPKKDLVNCTMVCKRWYEVAQSDTLWKRLDLNRTTLHENVFWHILSRGVEILRLAQTKVIPSTISECSEDLNNNYTCKLKYLDASIVMTSTEVLAKLLFKSVNLKMLSLESCTLNKACCEAISHCTNLSVLNLAMCEGIDNKCILHLLKLRNLTQFNISWSSLDAQCISLVCKLLPSCVTHLNISGYRKIINDNNIKDLANSCPDLLELDLSDNILLSDKTIDSIVKFNKLQHLSLSRCFNISVLAYEKLAYMPHLKYLDLFGLKSDMIPKSLLTNKFMFSSVARPTLSHSKRCMIWGLRVGD